MTEKLLTEAELSELTGVPVATLVAWRYRRQGPAFIKVGRLPRYRTEDVDAWLAARTVTTSDTTSTPRLRRIQ